MPINYSYKHLLPDEWKLSFNQELYHWWYVSRTNLLLSLIKLTKISSPRILDVGFGTGGNLLALAKLGKAFGIDISDKAVEFSMKRGINHICQSSAEKIPFKDKTFDIIACFDVLEHISEPVEMLLELRRVLKDEGKLIIMVPAFKALWSQHDEVLCHFRRYEKKSLFNDFSKARLMVDKASYFFFASFFIVAPARILSKLLYTNYLHYDTTTLLLKPINEIAKILFRIEARCSIRFGLPFGSSLYAIASKEK